MAWRQVVSVRPGSEYRFEAWLNNLIRDGNLVDPVFELRVNGGRVAGPLFLRESPDAWVPLRGVFRAAGASATLEIVSMSSASKGNDFGIDDVSVRLRTNLLANGSFSKGDVGFESRLARVSTGLLGPGEYSVRSDASTAKSSWRQFDRTSGTGAFLVCRCAVGTATVGDGVSPSGQGGNSRSGAGHVVWEQTRKLCGGRRYSFSAWAINLQSAKDLADPVVQLRINGVPVKGTTTRLPAGRNRWVKLSGSFLVPRRGAIRIVLQVASTGNAGGVGSFGVDDIALRGPDNLVTNGDFAAGNTGFTSGASFVETGLLAFGRYSVRCDPKTANSQWCESDHTTGRGKMLVCDGYSGKETVAWRQAIPVCPGESYEFSAWANNLIRRRGFSEPCITLRVNGKKIGIPRTLAESPSEWKQLSGIYTASGVITAVVEIVSTSEAAIGNDFAIDDIVFRRCKPPDAAIRPRERKK